MGIEKPNIDPAIISLLILLSGFNPEYIPRGNAKIIDINKEKERIIEIWQFCPQDINPKNCYLPKLLSNYEIVEEKNFNSINLKLISLGDVLESLNINYLSKNIIPEKTKKEDGEEKEDPTIENQKDKNDFARLFFTLKTNPGIDLTQIPRSDEQLNKILSQNNTGNNFTSSD